MPNNLPENAKRHYAQQLADEAKRLVPGMERLCEIAAELRADDLYRLLGFDTWEQFSTEYLGVSKRTANRWVDAWKKRAIPAQSAEKAISESAGQSVAAGQNVPVVESDALNSAKSSEGGAGNDEASSSSKPDSDAPGRVPPPSDIYDAEAGTRFPSTPPPPPEMVGLGVSFEGAGPSSGGAELQRPAPPTDEAALKRSSSRPAPPDPSSSGGDGPAGQDSPPPGANPERLPSRRMQASAIVMAFQDADEGVGQKWTHEEATYLFRRFKDERAAWAKANNASFSEQKPERRQGTITRPADRGLASTDPRTCAHPKDKRKHLGYIVKCEACGVKIA